MLPHMFVMNKVALTEALIFDGLLDEEDGEDRDVIAKAVEDLLWFYANEERPIAVGRPKNYRSGLLDRQGFDVGDAWELIKKEFKLESESEDYVVVLSEDAKAALHQETIDAAMDDERETVQYCTGEFPDDCGKRLKPAPSLGEIEDKME